MSRKPTLTPELAQRLAQLASTGISNLGAATTAGIDERTLYRWLQRGEQADTNWHNLTPDERDKEDRYRQFRQQFTQARASAQAVVAGHWRRAAEPHDVREVRTTTRQQVVDGEVVTLTDTVEVVRTEWDWRAGAEWLARTNPAEWARRQAVEVSGPDGGPVRVEAEAVEALREKIDRLRARDGD